MLFFSKKNILKIANFVVKNNKKVCISGTITWYIKITKYNNFLSLKQVKQQKKKRKHIQFVYKKI